MPRTFSRNRLKGGGRKRENTKAPVAGPISGSPSPYDRSSITSIGSVNSLNDSPRIEHRKSRSNTMPSRRSLVSEPHPGNEKMEGLGSLLQGILGGPPKKPTLQDSLLNGKVLGGGGGSALRSNKSTPRALYGNSPKTKIESPRTSSVYDFPAQKPHRNILSSTEIQVAKSATEKQVEAKKLDLATSNSDNPFLSIDVTQEYTGQEVSNHHELSQSLESGKNTTDQTSKPTIEQKKSFEEIALSNANKEQNTSHSDNLQVDGVDVKHVEHGYISSSSEDEHHMPQGKHQRRLSLQRTESQLNLVEKETRLAVARAIQILRVQKTPTVEINRRDLELLLRKMMRDETCPRPKRNNSSRQSPASSLCSTEFSHLKTPETCDGQPPHRNETYPSRSLYLQGNNSKDERHSDNSASEMHSSSSDPRFPPSREWSDSSRNRSFHDLSITPANGRDIKEVFERKRKSIVGIKSGTKLVMGSVSTPRPCSKSPIRHRVNSVNSECEKSPVMDHSSGGVSRMRSKTKSISEFFW